MCLQDFFDKEYSRFVTKGRFQSFYRFCIRLLSNILLPFYFIIVPRREKKVNKDLIVSLTTFPARISRFWLVIECIQRQEVQPYKICVWLAKNQFPNEFDSLPKKLVKYHKEGVIDIIFVDEDIRSHKKYFYAFKRYPSFSIITLDDDIFYPSFIIGKLVKLSIMYPDSICCLRGYEVTRDNQGEVELYKNWRIVRGSFGPTRNFFHTSGGGTLYKPSFFTEDIYDKNVFIEHCLYADDVWLNVMAQISEKTSIKDDYYSNLLPVLWNGKFKLSSTNVSSGGNDKQLELLLSYYGISKKKIFN